MLSPKSSVFGPNRHAEFDAVSKRPRNPANSLVLGVGFHAAQQFVGKLEKGHPFGVYLVTFRLIEGVFGSSSVGRN